jgi:hypothetical protein
MAEAAVEECAEAGAEAVVVVCTPAHGTPSRSRRGNGLGHSSLQPGGS